MVALHFITICQVCHIHLITRNMRVARNGLIFREILFSFSCQEGVEMMTVSKAHLVIFTFTALYALNRWQTAGKSLGFWGSSKYFGEVFWFYTVLNLYESSFEINVLLKLAGIIDYFPASAFNLLYPLSRCDHLTVHHWRLQLHAERARSSLIKSSQLIGEFSPLYFFVSLPGDTLVRKSVCTLRGWAGTRAC